MSMFMQKVKFLKTEVVYRTLRDNTAEVSEKFLEGEVYDLPVPSARRWIRRGVAVAVEEEAPKTPTIEMIEDYKIEPEIVVETTESPALKLPELDEAVSELEPKPKRRYVRRKPKEA